MEIYLDNNAATRPAPEVISAVVDSMGDGYGNPSSPHGRGAMARASIAKYLDEIGGFIGCGRQGFVLTSGGTEANNTVLASLRRRRANPRLAISAAEHPSVVKPAESAADNGRLTVLPLGGDGVVAFDAVEAILRDGLDLLSVQWASGETGVVQPIRRLAAMCRQHGTEFHVDAAQAVGRIALNLDDVGADYVTLSAHKMHGPQGVGALWTRNQKKLVPLIDGGGQQSGLRSGTENVPGAAGFAAACVARKSCFDEAVRRMTEMRDAFEAAVLAMVPDASVNGADAPRLCNTSSIRFPGVDGQALVAQLDRVGIRCSQTSACSSGRPEPSPTLLAMGLSEAAAWSTVRFAFSVLNSDRDAETAAGEVAAAVSRLRAFVRV